jgi:aminopeptidase N
VKAVLLTLFALQSLTGFAQDVLLQNYDKNELFMHSFRRMPVIDNYLPNNSFDVIKYSLNFDLYNCFRSPFPTSYTGSSVIIFKADSSIVSIQLNAVSVALIVDSVKYSGISFFQHNDVLYINLNRIHSPGETDSVKIYFRRNNITDWSLQNTAELFFTFLEPEGARYIFPCKDRQDDKAMFDLNVKVPSNVMLGSNGILRDTLRSADSLYLHWESQDPMATYLFSMIGSVNYRLSIYCYHKPNNPNDSIPIMLYYNNQNIPSSDFVNDIKQMTDFYSEKFTSYPFEKIGFANTLPVQFNNMENQTLSNMLAPWEIANIYAHEHGHQWFGDYITCRTWADIWLNEGFASYLEAFWDEHVYGTESYYAGIRSYNDFYLQNNRGFPIYNPSWVNHTPSFDSLFDYGIIYAKPACVIHTLRKTIGDTLFMHVLRAYMNDTNLAYKTASTNDFVQEVNHVTGQDYTWFFTEWLNQPNHPIYQNTMNIVDSGSLGWKLYFTISQVQTNTGFYRMPVKIKINYSDNSDSIALVQNTYNNQTYIFTSVRQPVGTVFDYGLSIVPKVANSVLGVNEIPSYYYLNQNYPNPFNSTTFITYALPYDSEVTLKIYDMTGRLVSVPVNSNQPAGEYKVKLDASDFASGVYFYRLKAGNYISVKKMVLVK